MTRTLLIALAVASLTGAAAAAEPERMILVLADGSTHEVSGPIERRDGMVLFRDARGRLGSLRAEDVADVRPAPEPSAARATRETSPAPPPVAERPATGAVLYTTDDLPALPPGTPSDAADPVAAADTTNDAGGEPATGAEAAGGPAAFEVAPQPTEAAGHPEAWWREEIARRRAAVDELQRQEAETNRLWVCAMQDIPLEGGNCRPQVNRQPPVNATPRTPTQRRLTDRLREIRRDLAAARDEVGTFIAESTAAGVPTAWLFEPDEPDEPDGPGEPPVEPPVREGA